MSNGKLDAESSGFKGELQGFETRGRQPQTIEIPLFTWARGIFDHWEENDPSWSFTLRKTTQVY
jgi:hypothetical protein